MTTETAVTAEPTGLRRVFYNTRELRAGWRLLIFMGAVTGLIHLENMMVRRFLYRADDTALFLVREISDFLIFLLVSLIMARFEGRTVAQYGLPWRGIFGTRFRQGILLGFASITTLLVAMRAVGVFHFGNASLHGFEIWRWAATYALVFMLVALREEFRARGYALYTLSAGIGFWPAAIVSAAYFGYSHHGNSGEDWIGVVNVALFGFLACFLLRRTGNLWLPIGFHLAFDWGETYFYGVPDSGQVLPGHLLNASISGPACCRAVRLVLKAACCALCCLS